VAAVAFRRTLYRSNACIPCAEPRHGGRGGLRVPRGSRDRKSRISIEIRTSIEPADLRRALVADVREGLSRRPRTLPPKYFYDTRGSQLFEEITRLPEYYLTRAERSILLRTAPSLVEAVRPAALVEFGSGSSGKTEILLDAGGREGHLGAYAPIDVSRDAIESAAERLHRRYPDLEILGIAGDFHDDLELPFAGMPRLVLLLGSTIGNFTPAEARAFARRLRSHLSTADAFLVGFDLVKDRRELVAAYDDERGVTAEFNRNVLLVLNRELGSDFAPETFRHRADWNEVAARIEMHLVSDRRQIVSIPSLELELEFERGESIRTELSHKYTRQSAAALLEDGGFGVERWETDERSRFGLALARPR
jgi:L-histidine N-alpha-methyltransferase